MVLKVLERGTWRLLGEMLITTHAVSSRRMPVQMAGKNDGLSRARAHCIKIYSLHRLVVQTSLALSCWADSASHMVEASLSRLVLEGVAVSRIAGGAPEWSGLGQRS
jgi:hypothetical protein